MTGQKVGRLTAIKRTGSDPDRQALWLCQCDCGNQIKVPGKSLRIGHTKSCGCLQRDVAQETAKVLGLKWGGYSVGKGSKGGQGRTPRQLKGRPTTHGHSFGSLTYASWKGMKQRCLNPLCPSYQYYGERGIKICERWLSFDNFLADMGERPEDPPGWTSSKHYWSLDRIGNDGHYEPGNVRWATKYDQVHNRRSYVRRKSTR